MATGNDNKLDFTVRVNGDGLEKLNKTLDATEAATKDLGTAATTAGAGVDKLSASADKAGSELAELAKSVEDKTQAIKAALQVEQSEIELQRQHLAASQAEQQAILQTATARGDDAAATQAQNSLRQIESDQLALVARAKRAEAEAVQQTTDARREQLAAVGPLTAAQAGATTAAENHAKALRVQADAADQASQRARDLGQSSGQVGRELAALKGAVDAKTAAIKNGLQVEQSEIELQRQHLAASQAEQQARLRAAQAKGDEAAATRASNALAQIESDQLGLVARAKRAEATATEQATAARREELAAIGPLSAAHAQELQAAENYTRALRVEAAAADQAAQRARELGTAHRSSAGATDQLGARVTNLTGLLGQMAGALGVAFSFRELVTAAAQMEQLRSGLTAVTGDATKAGKELEYVRTVASRIGADVNEVGRAFLSLSAATKGTAVEGEPTRQVFEAVATAMGKAGKSSAETSLALQAVAQIASKGTVQMEELRGQLGEALPGALNAVAKGLGITTAELIKLVEEGKIASSDLFPALTKGLNELYGAADGAQTLSQELTNVKNAVTDMAANIGDAGGLSALKVGAEIAQGAIVGLDAGLVAAGKSIGVVLAALANWDFSGLKQAFADIEKEAKDKVLKAAQHNETLRNSLKNSGDQAVITALAQQELANKTGAVSAAALAGASDFVKLQNGYRIVRESIVEQITAQEKSVIARDAEGKAAVALAAAFGTETEQRQAQAAAAAAGAAELERLAALKLQELATMQAELKALQDEVAQRGLADEAKSKQMAELEKAIALRQQETDKAAAQAGASRMVAVQARAEAEAVQDNSGRVDELREAYEKAQAALERMRAAKEAGLATTAALKDAENEAGRAALLYRDAVSDQVKAIQSKASAQQAALSLEQAGVQLAIAQQRAIFEVARAKGDEVGAMRAANEIRKLEIQLLQLTAQAKRAEAQSALATVAAKRAELEANGQLVGAKRLEMDAAQKSAEVKVKEAEIAEVTAKKMKDLADVHIQLGRDAGSAVKGIDDVTKALGRQAGAADGAGRSMQRLRSTSSGGGGGGGLGEGAPGTQQSDEYERKAQEAEKAGQHLAAANFRRMADRERHIADGQQKSRDIRYAAVNETDINQQIVKRYGEDALDDPLTREAWTLRLQLQAYQKNYGGPRSAQSLLEQRNIAAELERVEREIEAKRVAREKEREQERKAKEESNITGGKPGASGAGSDSGSRSSGSGISTGTGTGTGNDSRSESGGTTTYVSNITLPGGRTVRIAHADAESQSTTEQLLRDLAAGKGVFQ